MRFFILLVVALAVTVVWQTTIGASPHRVGSLDSGLPMQSSGATYAVTTVGYAVTLSA